MIAACPTVRCCTVASLLLALVGGAFGAATPVEAKSAFTTTSVPECCRRGSKCCQTGCCAARSPERSPAPARPAPRPDDRSVALLVADEPAALTLPVVQSRLILTLAAAAPGGPQTLQTLHVRLDA
jgi:hypothetical protein